MDTEHAYAELLNFLDRLNSAHVSFRLRYSLPRAISVDVDLPDGRWKVDFFEDGTRYVEKFVSREGVGGEEMWAEIGSDIEECISERRESGRQHGDDAG